MQRRKTLFQILLLIVLMLSLFEVSLLFTSTRIPSVSAVETPASVQAYLDAGCQSKAQHVDWGTVVPGQTRTFDLYLRNEGDTSVVLDLMAENWNPQDVSDNMTLSWNYNGCPIYQNQVKEVKLALSVSQKISGVTDFSFDIEIDCKECNLTLGEVAKQNILDAPANTVYFIYGDPSLQSRAESTYDSATGEIIRNLCKNNQNYGFNTRQNWVLPSGEINTAAIHNSTIALFGGRFANTVVNYYETVRQLIPVTFTIKNNVLVFENQTGTTLTEISLYGMDSSNYGEDMFVAIVFYDPVGDNTFFVMYGVGWKGTWAAGIYFKEVISQNLDYYTNSCYLFHWIDQNERDGVPQSHEIHQETAN